MCVCASAIVRRNEYGFCNSLGTPSGLAHLNAKRKEGNKKRERGIRSERGKRKARDVRQREKAELLMKRELEENPLS